MKPAPGHLALRKAIEKNTNLILVLAMGVGLMAPWVDKIPRWVILALLCLNMFFSCAKITVDNIKSIRGPTIGWFVFLRYLVLPVILFLTIEPVDFGIATAALLLTLAPSGLTAPAITGLVKGNVAFSILITIVTHLAFPLTAPIYLYVFVGRHIPIDTLSLFINLLAMVVLPALLFGLIRWRKPGAVAVAQIYATPISVLLIAMVIVVFFGQMRQYLFANPQLALYDFVWVSLFYTSYVLVGGWWLGWRQPGEIRIAMASASGTNNIALVLVVAILYLPPNVQLLVISAEIVWILSIPVFRKFIASQQKLISLPEGKSSAG